MVLLTGTNIFPLTGHCGKMVSTMPGITWDQTDTIALSLAEKFPDLDPTHIRYTDLHTWITELPDFADDPKASTEGKLEAIQMAWLEEYEDNH